MNVQEMFWTNTIIQIIGFVAVVIAVVSTRGGKSDE